jgi:hypothetical protein
VGGYNRREAQETNTEAGRPDQDSTAIRGSCFRFSEGQARAKGQPPYAETRERKILTLEKLVASLRVPMKRTLLCFLLVLISAALAPAQTQATDWTGWLPAKNPTYRDRYGIEHSRTNFSYRWKLSTPCSDKDCRIGLQIRNNGDRPESVNYIVEIEHSDGSFDSQRDHRNFDAHETQDIPLEGAQGRRVNEVRIEAS